MKQPQPNKKVWKALMSSSGEKLLPNKYSKSPTYEGVVFQECIPKSNLFVSPTKLA